MEHLSGYHDYTLFEVSTKTGEVQFDTYLYLLREYNNNPGAKIILSYDKLAPSLGIEKMTREDYRRQITKVLEKLRDKYKLIDLKTPERSQAAQILLKDINDPMKLYTAPSKSLEIPTAYWRYGWNKRLPFSAKVMYLINLAYTSPSSPSWFMARSTISKKHNISESFISDGTRELRKLNLLAIEYGELEGIRFDERHANVYTPKPLYDPLKLEESIKDLEAKHGREKIDRARQSAALVFEENNLRTIQALIDLEEKYGVALIEEALNKLKDKSPDNPKRSAGYLINSVKSMARNK